MKELSKYFIASLCIYLTGCAIAFRSNVSMSNQTDFGCGTLTSNPNTSGASVAADKTSTLDTAVSTNTGSATATGKATTDKAKSQGKSEAKVEETKKTEEVKTDTKIEEDKNDQR